jgi:glucuronoarabinoxylan endo-1,4-beta-xylanase
MRRSWRSRSPDARSKFVRPGFVRIDVSSVPPGVSMTAFQDASSANPVVVAINTSGDKPMGISFAGNAPSSVTPWVTSATLDLAPQASVPLSGNRVQVTLPAQSVTTLVGN